MECRAGKVSEPPPPSNQDGERTDCEEEEFASECHDAPEPPKARSGCSITEPPRFHIPRRKKEKRALFQYLSSDSREYTEILKIITSSYKDPSSSANYVYSKPRLVHNEPLEKDFIEKRKELKVDGRTEKELAESFCFLLCDSSKVGLVCEKGLSVGSSWMNILGNSSKGVYLCQFSDLLQISPYEPGSTGEIIIFKVLKGKVKSIHDNMSRMDPTPKFDSHFSKNANRVTSQQSYKAFEYTQQYFYEYVDYELSARPRHVCPYAVVSFQFKGKETTSGGPKSMPLRRSSSLTSGREKCSYIVWKGQFVNAGKDVFQASLRCFSQPFLPFKLPDRLEIGKVMRLDQVKGIISSSLFSWDLYSGSHEVFKRGLHCSLFEVVEEKSKSGESLNELFQKLEEEGLVMVNSLSDNGFLFLLSSSQMSNLGERRAGWRKSNLQALFIYRAARDVSKFSYKRPAACTPLLPVPEDQVMPHLKSFLPALHYGLSKVRSNPPVNLSAGVEQQARDYLSSLCEGKPIQRVRLDYEHKLDDRERLFPAPRQKYNWESFVRSYLFSPGQFTIPVEKAKNVVEALGCVPEFTVEPETAEHVEAQRDPEKLKELLKVIQMNKTQGARKKEKDSEDGVLHSQALKRKLEEGQEISSKCVKKPSTDKEDLGGGEAETLQNLLSSIGLRDTDLRKDDTQGASKMMLDGLLDKLRKTTHDTDLRKDKMQGFMVMKILEQVTKTLTGTDSKVAESTEKTEATLYESVTGLGLPANCDIDLRNRFGNDDREGQGKNDLEKLSVDVRLKRRQVQAGEEETAGSLSSLEAFSPCSDTNGQQRGVNLLGEKSIPWVLIPITGLKTDRYCHRDYPKDENLEDPRFLQSPTVSTHTSPEKKDPSPPDQPDSSNVGPEPELESVEDQDTNLTDELKFSHCQEQRAPSFSGIDCIVDQQISDFSTEVEDLLREERVYYVPHSSSETQRQPLRTPVAPFSEYISLFNTPLPVHNYITSFRDSISAFIDPQHHKWDCATRVCSALPSPSHSAVSSSAPDVPPLDLLLSGPLPSPGTVAAATPSLTSDSLVSTSSATTHTSYPPPNPMCSRPEQASLPHRNTSADVPQDVQTLNGQRQGLEWQEGRVLEEPCQEGVSGRSGRGFTVEPQSRLVSSAGESPVSTGPANEAPASISSLISQLQPEVISNLVKIIRGVQENVVHFYVHSAEEESDVCWEIKEYLKRLGNAECDPQKFLEKRESQDKLLVIIQNIDIAALVHKIPALVSLKKLPSVSFAGVDSLDDIRNHTYNELFVSGGFIVSDEFVLNPDFITQERLQTLLQYLEELNTPESPWRWWVHCKTHKKVKEQSRCKSEALSVLNLLTTYHKKQIVEFLSYHECDAPSHQAPDLDCLVKLQAQNIRQRHVIFLTESRFQMFPHYSSSGIVIANIEDVLYNMASLIGEAGDKPPSPNPPSYFTSPTLQEDDMVLCSDTDSSSRNVCPLNDTAPPDTVHDPYPRVSYSRTGENVNTGSLSSPTVEVPQELDFEALKAAVSQFRVARMQANSHTGQSSSESFSIAPHQSFLNQGDLPSAHPQSSTELLSVSDSTFKASQCVVSQPSSPMQLLRNQMLETSTSEPPTHGFTHVETSPVSEFAIICQHGAQDEARPNTNNVRQVSVPGMVDPDTPGPVASPGMTYAVTETTSNISSDLHPTWNRATNTDSPDKPASPETSGAGTNFGQDKDSSEVGTTENLLVTAVSSRTQSNINSSVSAGSVKHNSQAGLLPVPDHVTYSVGNPLVAMDSLFPQASCLWNVPQGARNALSSQNGALRLRSPLLNTSMASSLGVVTHSGLGGLLHSGNLPMAWNGWGVQQGIGQVHPTRFIQSYTWQGNPPFQGSGYPPRRGGYGSW